MSRAGHPGVRLATPQQEHRFRKRLGALIRKAREAEELSQRELAEQLGCSQSRIAHYETGRGAPRVFDLAQILKAVSVESIDLWRLLD